MKNIKNSYLALMYLRFKLALKGITTLETPKSLQFELLTSSVQKLAVTSALMANHKTTKSGNEYNYNFWEFKVPESNFDFLICVCQENFEGEIKQNGFFVFPKSILKSFEGKNTINIFESDISGLYSKEPKCNKNKYFENCDLLLNE